MSDTPGPPDPDLAARLARLQARVAAREPDYLGAIFVSVGLLTELFRQRDALAAELEEARAELGAVRQAVSLTKLQGRLESEDIVS